MLRILTILFFMAMIAGLFLKLIFAAATSLIIGAWFAKLDSDRYYNKLDDRDFDKKVFK